MNPVYVRGGWAYAHDYQGLGVAEDSAAPLSGDPVVGKPKEAPLLGYILTQKRFMEYGLLIGVRGGGRERFTFFGYATCDMAEITICHRCWKENERSLETTKVCCELRTIS